MDMGRKRIPKTQRREVISISLKPSTIALIDEQISESTPRSQFIEKAILEYFKAFGMDSKNTQSPRYKIHSFFDCLGCETSYNFGGTNRKEIYCMKCQDFVPLSRQEKVEL